MVAAVLVELERHDRHPGAEKGRSPTPLSSSAPANRSVHHALVRRRSFGCVLPLGRHASTNGSKLIQCASDSIALSSFQEGQNARHHNPFKLEQALAHQESNTTDVLREAV